MIILPSHASVADRGQRPPGFSLVIVVAMIALLMLVTLGLLTLVGFSRQRTQLDERLRRSDALADTAFNTVLADIRSEMTEGSTTTEEFVTADGTTVRHHDLSGNPRAMVVARALRDAATFASTTLVKESAPGVPFHPYGKTPPQRASEVSSAAGKDGVPPATWRKSQLLPPDISFTTASAPTWTYVDRSGGNPTKFAATLRGRRSSDGSPNPDYVIGRYAWQLYDTSGLLDINVAGSPAIGGPDPQRAGDKGSLAFADLALLPGMNPAAADQLAHWRHDWQGDPQEYIRLSEGSGWRKMVANDNLFLGRQDLLEFATLRPDALSQAALPFLTHFSRDLDAPSHRPDPRRPKVARGPAAGGNDAYKADDIVNPDLGAYDENRQQFLMPRRFPLERLKWVRTPARDGPEDPEKAERYFGLRWQGTHWEYVHARSNGDLHTLQDVPTDRDPDFFEILRATVLAGSLGRQYASRGHDDLDQRLSMHRLGGVDASVNLNILEMGACLIDQYDEDSDPTSIELGGSARTYYAFGKEDVPYLHRLSAIPYRGQGLSGVKVYNEDGTPAQSEAYECTMVLQPMLWRPHQVVEDSNGPTNFRIRPQHVDLGGGSIFYMTQGWTVPRKGGRPGVPSRAEAGDYSYWGGPNYRATKPEFFPRTFLGNDYIDITVPASSTAFREPQSVHSSSHARVAGYTIGGNVDPIPVRNGDLRWNGLPRSYRDVSGFVVGYALTARVEPGSSSWQRLGVGYFRGDPIEVMMEYQAPDGTWRPYQRAEFTYKSNWGDHYLRPNPLWETEAFHWSSYLIDPRTARFGGLATVLAGGIDTSRWTSLDRRMTWPEGSALAFGRTREEGVRPGWTGPAANTGWNWNEGSPGWYWGWNQAGVAENNETTWAEAGSAQNGGGTFAYKDPDDVLRPGVGAFNEYDRSMFLGNPMSRRYQLSSSGKLNPDQSMAGRPIILNRPFRSVAELAYSFRGTPWRDIDFVDASSPDAGLLDVFCLYEDPEQEALPADDPARRNPRIVAGRVNLNTASPEVLSSLISGVARDHDNLITPAEADTLAELLASQLHSTSAGAGPLSSKAQIVSRPGSRGKNTSLITRLSDQFTSAEDRSINDRRESITRALSDGTTVRSWCFTLDLVVQSGMLPPSASDLDGFHAVAERRYWVHFAVDRLRGQLLDVQWELVNQ